MNKAIFWNCGLIFSFVLMLTGCVSVSQSPNPRFYMPSPMSKEEAVKKIDIVPGVIVAVGPVKIPEYQDRPQIVTKNKNGTFNFAQFDRWAEPLDSTLARLISDNLVSLLPAASFQLFPCSFAIPLDYQVIVEVTQLDSQLDQELALTAQWSIIDAKNRKLLLTTRSQFTQPINPHDYFGLTRALSLACSALSRQIAENLASISKHPRP